MEAAKHEAVRALHRADAEARPVKDKLTSLTELGGVLSDAEVQLLATARDAYDRVIKELSQPRRHHRG